jgi:hypothetical protein
MPVMKLLSIVEENVIIQNLSIYEFYSPLYIDIINRGFQSLMSIETMPNNGQLNILRITLFNLNV